MIFCPSVEVAGMSVLANPNVSHVDVAQIPAMLINPLLVKRVYSTNLSHGMILE